MIKINWDAQNNQPKPMTMAEKVAEHQILVDANIEANKFLAKAAPLLRALLQVKLENHSPLKVMRPIVYDTSDFPEEEEDDGFYFKKSTGPSSFIDKKVVIPAGETIVFKSLYNPMREFIFEDSKGKEHSISFDQANLLMTQTDIYDQVKAHMS